MIIVIDYDAGNTANVLRALEKIGVTAELSADKEKILAADGLILPGVGAYPTAMAELERRGRQRGHRPRSARGRGLYGRLVRDLPVQQGHGAAHRRGRSRTQAPQLRAL